MIVKNEVQLIDKCLDYIKDIADEVIIVDSESTIVLKRVSKKVYRQNI